MNNNPRRLGSAICAELQSCQTSFLRRLWVTRLFMTRSGSSGYTMRPLDFPDSHRIFNNESQSDKISTPRGKERQEDFERREEVEQREDFKPQEDNERQEEIARWKGKQQLEGREQPHDSIYEALWNKFERDDMKTKDLSKWIAELKSELGSARMVEGYFKWVNVKLRRGSEYVLDPIKLAIDLGKADWIEGNSYLLRLNSGLSYSITAVVTPPISVGQDLEATYKGYPLGLQIHGRPIAYRHADFDEYADKGIAVNSELVLALGYYPHVSTSIKFKLRKESMLFAPLGYVLTEFGFPRQWIYTGLVLIVEIKQNGKAGALHLLFPQRAHPDVDPETFDRSDSLCEEGFMRLQEFQKGIAFTVAKLEDGFSLLKYGRLPFYLYEDIERTLTVISNSRVEIVATGSMIKEKPSISFPLYPDD